MLQTMYRTLLKHDDIFQFRINTLSSFETEKSTIRTTTIKDSYWTENIKRKSIIKRK